MKMTKRLIAVAIWGCAGAVCRAYGQDSVMTSSNEDNHIDRPLYRAQELDLDLFGSSTLGQETLEHFSGNRFRHHVLYGGGGGLSYFFLKYVGVGGEFDADARSHRFVDSADGNVFLRLPIYDTGLSPYVFGGGGYQFEEVRQSFEQGGGGLEFRFCRHAGIFADGRYVFCRQTKDYAEVRAGLRISF